MFVFFTPDGLLVLVLSMIAGAAVGWGLARWGQAGLAWALVAMVMLVALGVSLYGYSQPGLRGIGPAMAGIMIIAPIGVAAALGILIETLRRRRAAVRALQDDDDGPAQGGGPS